MAVWPSTSKSPHTQIGSPPRIARHSRLTARAMPGSASGGVGMYASGSRNATAAAGVSHPAARKGLRHQRVPADRGSERGGDGDVRGSEPGTGHG